MPAFNSSPVFTRTYRQLWAVFCLSFCCTIVNAETKEIRDLLSPLNTSPHRLQWQHLIDTQSLQSFYQARDNQLAWDESGRALILLRFIQTAEQHGLRSYDYLSGSIIDAFAMAGAAQLSDAQKIDLDLKISAAGLGFIKDLRFGRVSPRQIEPKWRYERAYEDIGAQLNQSLKRTDLAQALESLAPQHHAYQALKHKLSLWRHKQFDATLPLIADGPLLKPGMQDPRVPELRERLGLPKTTGIGYDSKLKLAVQRFQSAHGLTADALIGDKTIDALNRRRDSVIATIRANLERQRWYGNEQEQRHLLVNIPDFSLSAIEEQQTVLQMRAIVGQEERETPLIESQINRIVFKPYWRVPHSIVIRDLLPKFKADPGYAAARGFEFLRAWGGQTIAYDQINWSQANENNFNYQVRQKPGPQNALGNIKFLFPNPYAVYIHDTASRGLFGTSNRSYSSGCVRIEKPRELFDWLTRDEEAWTLNMNGDKQDAIYKPAQTVPVKIRYQTAWVDQNNDLQLRRDIYGLDRKLLSILDQTEVAANRPQTTAP